MRWKRGDEYHIASECGRFTVARIGLPPYRYVAWMRHPHPQEGQYPWGVLAYCDDSVTARAVCEKAEREWWVDVA